MSCLFGQPVVYILIIKQSKTNINIWFKHWEISKQNYYLNLSCPAVSQICSFTDLPATLIIFDPNSTPIVWLLSPLTVKNKNQIMCIYVCIEVYMLFVFCVLQDTVWEMDKLSWLSCKTMNMIHYSKKILGAITVRFFQYKQIFYT